MNLKKINIGMLLEDSFPFDIRVEKEAKSLISAGYKVHLLCLSDKAGDEYSVYKGIHVYRIGWGKNKFARFFNKLINRIFLQNNFWKHEIELFIQKNDIKVLHVHDLPLLIMLS